MKEANAEFGFPIRVVDVKRRGTTGWKWGWERVDARDGFNPMTSSAGDDLDLYSTPSRLVFRVISRSDISPIRRILCDARHVRVRQILSFALTRKLVVSSTMSCLLAFLDLQVFFASLNWKRDRIDELTKIYFTKTLRVYTVIHKYVLAHFLFPTKFDDCLKLTRRRLIDRDFLFHSDITTREFVRVISMGYKRNII